jgi:MYXO-CTERM domain-containing protein
MSRLFALAAALLLGIACGGEDPFDNHAWEASCSVAPYDFLVIFPGAERLDESGARRSYLAHVDIEVDPSGLEDSYLWQVDVDDAGTAETVWMERAPIPDDVVVAYDLKPLTIAASTFQQGQESASITGTCTWDDEPGDFGTDTSWCDSYCFQCATGGDPRHLGLGAAVAAALVVGRRRG